MPHPTRGYCRWLDCRNPGKTDFSVKLSIGPTVLKAVFRTGPMILRLIGLIFFMAPPIASHAMEDVEQARNLLKKMASANRQLNYEGIFTYEHAGILKSIRITHVVHGGLEYEQLLYLNGPEREVVRTGVSPDCRNFGDEFLKGVPMPSEYSTHLETHYELFLKGEDRVAGRNVRVIHVVPKDGMRYGFILSLDRETNLLLQSLLVGPDRRVMERFQYVDIDYRLDGPAVAEALTARTPTDAATVESGGGVEKAGECQRAVDDRVPWQAKWLPAGFRLVSASLEDRGEASLVYSDGLSFVSVFINEDGDAVLPPIQAQRGATVAQMARLNHNESEYQICVVGEVPPATAERIAKFIAPR